MEMAVQKEIPALLPVKHIISISSLQQINNKHANITKTKLNMNS